MQTAILIITLILMLIIAYPFISTIRNQESEAAADKVESGRRKLIWGMLVVGVIVTAVSLRTWPHAVASGSDVIQINATGGQWYWEIDKQEVEAGKPVVFNLHTEDVNHGFGVINASGRLLFQTQAMPGYVNKVEYVFQEPGEYRVLCLEFCGIGHHGMIDIFTVKKN